MKKIYFLIALLILGVISIPMFSSSYVTEDTIVSPNPGTDAVRVLGDNIEIEVEEPKENKTSKRIEFDKQKLYMLINSHRKENKLSPLNINQSLERSSGAKVTDMIENNYFKHEDKNNIQSWYLFQSAGYNYQKAGENLSSGANSPWKVFDAWKDSQKHNSQMLSDSFLDMGITADCDSYKIDRKSSCIVVLHLGIR